MDGSSWCVKRYGSQSACFFQIARETMLLLINNIHDKIIQNLVIRLRYVQKHLFTFDCQHFHNEKTFFRTTEVKCYKHCNVTNIHRDVANIVMLQTL